MLPTELQTTPYITLMRPNEPWPVIYVTDTLGPEYPDAAPPPPEALFGIVPLDRRVVWRSDAAALDALEAAAPAPMPIRDLIASFGADVVDDLVWNNWLQAPDALCREYFLRTGQIEITAHCNWGCRYCPVATDPKPRETMPMDLFEEIIEKLSPYETIRFVTFHFFNEPTLDPHFEDRIRVLERYGMRLSLSSNLTALTPAKTKLLCETGVLHHLIVNLPSLNEPEFRHLTGSSLHAKVLRNLEPAIEACFPITIAVNGVGNSLDRNVRILKARYEHRSVEVRPTTTCDRAGVLTNEFSQQIAVTGRLTGCSWPVNHAYFSVRGDMFICCNDYYQREVFGNIRDGSLDDVMTSPLAVKLRRRVFGVDTAPSDYICRSCHDQTIDFVHRQFRPPATFRLSPHVTVCGRGTASLTDA